MDVMGRTNIVIDEDLVRKVMRMYGLTSKRAAVDFALRRVAGEPEEGKYRPRDMLDLRGMGWGGDLEEMRGGPIVDPWS